MKIYLFALIFTTQAFAAVFTVEGNQVRFTRPEFKVSEFVIDYSKYKSLNVVFADDFQDNTTYLMGPKLMGVGDLDLYVSLVLQQNGFTKFLVSSTNTLSIMNSRDIRYRKMGTHTDVSQVPDTYDHAVYMHNLKYVPASDIARNFRPLTSRYGRIIDHTGDGLLISDTGKSIRMMAQLLEVFDTEAHGKAFAELKELNEKNRQITVKSKGILEILGDNTVVFLALFCLIGGIIGFGARGYLIKRIEGGW